MTRRRRELSEEDRALWSSVARTVTPLHPRAPATRPEPEPGEPVPEAGSAVERIQAAIPRRNQPAPPAPGPIDRPTSRKIARGRIGIDDRIDLHSMTQEQAHFALLAFLRRARADGLRHVLIITGKGSTGEGVLRRSVPAWLRTAPFRELVGAFDIAARHHGGEGAIYVRLRRQRVRP